MSFDLATISSLQSKYIKKEYKFYKFSHLITAEKSGNALITPGKKFTMGVSILHM